MNPLCQSKATKKFSDCWSELCRYQLQKECDTTITVYDEPAATEPVYSHQKNATISIPLWKLIVALGIAAAFCTLLRGFFSLFSE